MLARRILRLFDLRILVVGFGFEPGTVSNHQLTCCCLRRKSLRSGLLVRRPVLVSQGTALGKARYMRRWTDWRKTGLENCFDVIVGVDTRVSISGYNLSLEWHLHLQRLPKAQPNRRPKRIEWATGQCFIGVSTR